MRALLCLLCILGCFCAGCSAQEAAPSQEVYEIYFPQRLASFHQPALGREPLLVSAGEDPVEAILEALLQPPKKESLKRIIPSGVVVRDWRLSEGTLYVDFSSFYGLLSGIDLTLADYSVTMSLIQIIDVEAVVLTVEGASIDYRDRNRLFLEDIICSID